MKHWKTVIALCGSCISLYIGSGFATMQEVLWYKASCRSLFWVVIIATALIYIYMNLSFAAFFAEDGAKNRLSEVNKGMLLYSLFIFSVAVLCCVALISNIDVLYSADIPALVLANQISSALGLAFAVIVLVGIYTSAVPLLWIGVRRLAEEGVNKYRLITVFSGVFWLRHRMPGLLCASVQRALRP